jgi:hypothetical protein
VTNWFHHTSEVQGDREGRPYPRRLAPALATSPDVWRNLMNFCCWAEKGGRKTLPRLFNGFDGKYTEGVIKKHRPKERCQVLDKSDTIKLRKYMFFMCNCKCFSTIYRLPFFSLLYGIG